MKVLNEFKNYKRDFILLNRNTAMLIHMFNKDSTHDLEDIVLEDHDEYLKNMVEIHKESAKQLLKQFEGNECVAFIEALRDECNNYLNKDKECKETIKHLLNESNSNK